MQMVTDWNFQHPAHNGYPEPTAGNHAFRHVYGTPIHSGRVVSRNEAYVDGHGGWAGRPDLVVGAQQGDGVGHLLQR